MSGIREADKLIKICNTVSTSDHDVESAIEISPNPATDSIRIYTNLSIKSITVYNELGQEQDIELEKNKNIYIEKLAKGTYTVKIETDSKTAVKKFVKN